VLSSTPEDAGANTLWPSGWLTLGGGATPEMQAGYERLERLGAGAMGVVYRAFDAQLKRTVALTRGEEKFVRLPGTRFEVESIARLVGPERVTLLLGSSASEQKIDRLLDEGTLQKARAIHLATHGLIHPLRPEHSSLVMARDQLPDPLEPSSRGRKVYDGHLRVSTILEQWNLDADLVVVGLRDWPGPGRSR
jgi:CHAT domain-containing protein